MIQRLVGRYRLQAFPTPACRLAAKMLYVHVRGVLGATVPLATSATYETVPRAGSLGGTLDGCARGRRRPKQSVLRSAVQKQQLKQPKIRTRKRKIESERASEIKRRSADTAHACS